MVPDRLRPRCFGAGPWIDSDACVLLVRGCNDAGSRDLATGKPERVSRLCGISDREPTGVGRGTVGDFRAGRPVGACDHAPRAPIRAMGDSGLSDRPASRTIRSIGTATILVSRPKPAGSLSSSHFVTGARRSDQGNSILCDYGGVPGSVSDLPSHCRVRDDGRH